MLAHVPPWVFGVFVLLLALGILLSRPRAVHPVAPVLMAAGFIAYSLYGVISSFDLSPASVLPWAAGALASVFLGGRLFGPSGMTRVTGTGKILVPGSWVPLALMMGIFLAKFVVGFVRGAHLPVGTQAWFAPAVCAALGCLSGGFTTRALNVRRFARSPASGD